MKQNTNHEQEGKEDESIAEQWVKLVLAHLEAKKKKITEETKQKKNASINTEPKLIRI